LAQHICGPEAAYRLTEQVESAMILMSEAHPASFKAVFRRHFAPFAIAISTAFAVSCRERSRELPVDPDDPCAALADEIASCFGVTKADERIALRERLKAGNGVPPDPKGCRENHDLLKKQCQRGEK